MNAPVTAERIRESAFSSKPTARIERMREGFFTIKPTYSITRARIEARVMKETQAEPMISRRAKVFAAVVREMPIDVYPDELIVGYSSDRPRCANISPGSLDPSRLSADYLGFSDDEIKELQEDLIPFWTQQGRNGRFWHYGHNIHGLEKVVRKGFLSIKKEAEDALARLDLTEPGDMKKVAFLEGVVLSMQAAAELGRYWPGYRFLPE